jgi:quercetin dioxygenase-like cupin family protein
MKRHILLVLASLVLLVSAALAIADDAAKNAAKSNAAAAMATPAQAATPAADHRTFLPGDFKWVDAPPGLPKGAKMAVIHGDPSAPGLFAMRAMLPAGYKVPPHFHPADENVTVISGEFYMGMGDTWDESKGHALPPGAVSIMPAGAHHFAWSKVETVIQIHAMGPWGITYLNPQDDPRNMKQATK